MELYIYSDKNLVHASGAVDYEHRIISGNLTLGLNRSGSLTFSVPPTNEAYKNGLINDLNSVIEVRNSPIQEGYSLSKVNSGEQFVWRGRVVNKTIDFLKGAEFTCEGVLGRLNDVCTYPIANRQYFLHKDSPDYSSTNPDPDLLIPTGTLMKFLIGQYNDRLDKWRDPYYETKRFIPSYDGQNWFITRDYTVSRKNPFFENMLDYIQSEVIQYGFYYGYRIEAGVDDATGVDKIFIRPNTSSSMENGKYKTTFPTTASALILGKNMTNYSYRTDYSQIKTAMHYKGTIGIDTNAGDLEEEGDIVSEPVEYVYPDFGANGYTSSDEYARIKKYGLIMGHEELNGEYVYGSRTEARNAFYSDARKRLEDLADVPTETIEISGADIDSNFRIRVGYYIPVISRYHGIQAKYLCNSCSFDLCNPANNTYTLGSNEDGIIDKWRSVYKQDIPDNQLYLYY